VALALGLLTAAPVSAPAQTLVSVAAGNSVVFEGQDAVFRISSSASVAADIVVHWRMVGGGGFGAADLESAQVTNAHAQIPARGRQVEVRMRVVHDSLVESGERMTFSLLSVSSINLPGSALALGDGFSVVVNVHDTFRARITGPGIRIAEGGDAVYTVEIGGGLTNHPPLLLAFVIPDSNGMRNADIAPPEIRHSGATPSGARNWGGVEGGWLATVPFRDNNGAAGFTITVNTTDDNEPENLEELCVQLRSLAQTGSAPHRFQFRAPNNACTQVTDDDGSLTISAHQRSNTVQ